MIDWFACALVKVFGGLACRLPPSVCVRIGEVLGELAMFFQPRRVRIGLLNLKAAFGEPRPGLPPWAGQAGLSPKEARRIIRGIFRNMGAGVMEMLYLSAIDNAYLDRYVELVGREHFNAALASGRPVVMLTAHFGNWELTSIITALEGHPIVALARAQQGFPRLYKLLVSYRESKGCYIVHKGKGMRRLVQAIRRGDLTGVVGDQASRQGVAVEFFGRSALFATGPFELARSHGALIVPGFIHRLRGPFHRGFLEPVIDLAQAQGTAEDIIRSGIERFAALLTRHIEQSPEQWLWMHKRWKHTTARRVLVLSDGKLGHVKQSLAVVKAMQELQNFDVREQVVEVAYRNRLGRILATAWAWLVPGGLGKWPVLRLALTSVCYQRLARAYADVVVSCGASTAPVNALLSRELRAKSVVLMNPAPIPLSRFSLAFVPAHDQVRPAPNIVQTYGALTGIANGQLTEARDNLQLHPKWKPPPTSDSAKGRMAGLVAVFLGGDNPEYRVTAEFTDVILQQVLAACEAVDGACLVTTSRRTPAAVEQRLADRLASHPRCRFLLLAGRDPLDGTLEGMLGWADAVVVTGESISMVSEACASGRPVIVVEPPVRPGSSHRLTKPQRYLETLVREGYVHRHPPHEIGQVLQRVLTERPAVRRLDTYETVRDAVKRVL